MEEDQKTTIAIPILPNPMFEMIGYTPLTTFWEDFSIADHFGFNAIVDTFNKVSKGCEGNYKHITELAMVLNHKCWQYEREGNDEYERLYGFYYEMYDSWVARNLKGDELKYYYETID